MSSCAILVPSLGRPQYLRDMAENIHAATPELHRILWCVGDEQSRDILDRLGEDFLWDGEDPDKRYVTRMNKLITYLEDETDVFFGSDDVVHERGWLTEARRVQEQGFAVVVVNDLRNPNGTQALMRTEYLPRACFDDPTAAFHKGYQHNYADTEQFETARLEGQLARCMNSIVEHLHPGASRDFFTAQREARPQDATYTNAFASWHQDAELFTKRMRLLAIHYG